MRNLIIPDVHENIYEVKRLLAVEMFDRAYFLGDWVDRFKTQPGDLEGTIRWLYQNIERPEYEFYLGNHDIPYMFDIYELGCSGHQADPLIGAFFKSEAAMAKFKLAGQVEGWTLSHAGIDKKFISILEDGVQKSVLSHLKAGNCSNFVAAGRSRGGYNPVGGVTWLDFNGEFTPIKGVKQIVGHTRGGRPRRKTNNYCIDTGLNHYAIVEDGQLSIMNIDGSRFTDFDPFLVGEIKGE